eukprot:643797-Hanusia_phi.AAC.1
MNEESRGLHLTLMTRIGLEFAASLDSGTVVKPLSEKLESEPCVTDSRRRRTGPSRGDSEDVTRELAAGPGVRGSEAHPDNFSIKSRVLLPLAARPGFQVPKFPADWAPGVGLIMISHGHGLSDCWVTGRPASGGGDTRGGARDITGGIGGSPGPGPTPRRMLIHQCWTVRAPCTACGLTKE